MMVVFLSGCQDQVQSTSLPTLSTTMCDQTITLEIAKDTTDKSQGLMFRSSLASNHGMIFVYDHEQNMSFWMKNVSIPLSIGFFDSLGRLVSHLEMSTEDPTTPDSILKIYHSSEPAQYAVEMSAGWFENKTDCMIDLRFLQN